MSSNLSELIASIDQLITEHRLEEARSRLLEVSLDAIPDNARREMAILCRRADLSERALKLLHPLVHERTKADAKDQIEYSSTLRKLGMPRQALSQLTQAPDFPERELYLSFCHIHLWDWPSAEPLLRNFLSRKDVPERLQLVARANLCLSLLGLGKLDEAAVRIETLLGQTLAVSPHLHLNALEMLGQLHIQRRDYAAALEHLDAAKEKTRGQASSSANWIEKWRQLSLVLQGKEEDLKTFLLNLRRSEQWETLRDIDRHLAIFGKSVNRAHNAFYGTPYPAFKAALKARLSEIDFPDLIYKRDLRVEADLEQDCNLPFGIEPSLSFGKLSHRLLLLLLSDAYRPWTVYRIFDELHADQIFDPETSADRVYQALGRLKSSIAKEDLPFEFKSTNSGFRVRVLGKRRVLMASQQIFTNPCDFFVFLIRSCFPKNNFRIDDIAPSFQSPKSSLQKLVSQAEAQGYIRKMGRGLYCAT